MKTTKTAALATLGLLAGCGGTAELSGTLATPNTTLPEGEAPPSLVVDEEALQADLELLASLSIVEVGRLVRDYPEGAMNCYGPCPGFEDEIAAEDARQAARLEQLVGIASSAASVTLEDSSCSVEVIDENLAALDGLDIIEVFGLVEEVPQNNPYCYNTPCPEDVEAAEEINCQRATALATIVAESAEL